MNCRWIGSALLWVVVLFLILADSAKARTNAFDWSKRICSTTNGDGEFQIGMVLDSQRNIYVTGWFDNINRTNNFGGVILTNRTGGGQDIFVAKYTSAGALQWARRAGGATPEWDAGRGIGVDNAGNVYVTGQFYGTADFGNTNLTGLATESQFFLVKYNSTGVVQWARQCVASDSVYGTGMAVDGAGNCYIVGYANNNTFSPITFGTNNLTSPSDFGYSTFLVKYDSNGNNNWAQLIGGPGQTYATKVAVDTTGNVYVRGTLSLDIAIGNTNLVSIGSEDQFIAKFDTFGSLIWVRQEGGDGDDGGEGGVAIDSAGNVYVTGAYESNPYYFDGGASVTNAGVWDCFIAKYDSSGAFQWARRGGGVDLDFFGDVALDPQGNIYVSGILGSNVVARGLSGAIVAKYGPSGAFQFAYSARGAAADPVGSLSAKVAVDSAGNAFLAGWYLTTTTFGTNTLQPQRAGTWNYFLTRLATADLPPAIQANGVQFGVRTNRFGFNILGASNLVVVVEGTTNLANPIWSPLGTNTLTGGTSYFSDSRWTNLTRRFYRLRCQD